MNDLLICAELLGYETLVDPDGVIHYRAKTETGLQHWFNEYNPLTNNAQAMELLKWILTRDMSKYGHVALERFGETDFYVSAADLDSDRWAFKGNGKALNEAIINAVVAMEESK